MILGTEEGMPVGGKSAEAVGIEAEGSATMLEPMSCAVAVSVAVADATFDPLRVGSSVLGSSLMGVILEGEEAAAVAGNTVVWLPALTEPALLGTLAGALLDATLVAAVSVAGPLNNPAAPVEGTEFNGLSSVVTPAEAVGELAVASTGVTVPRLPETSEPANGLGVPDNDATTPVPDGAYPSDVSVADVIVTT